MKHSDMSSETDAILAIAMNRPGYKSHLTKTLDFHRLTANVVIVHSTGEGTGRTGFGCEDATLFKRTRSRITLFCMFAVEKPFLARSKSFAGVVA